MPPAPTRIVDVPEATWQMTTDVAALAACGPIAAPEAPLVAWFAVHHLLALRGSVTNLFAEHRAVFDSLREGLGIAPIDEWSLHHHENWDGSGYPGGLAGEDIPLGARIIRVADAFEAMTANRPYRAAQPVEYALNELRANAGTQFERAAVAAVEACVANASPAGKREAPMLAFA